jgi:proteasome activator subunit 4
MSIMFPFVSKLLPQLFEMQELHDNQELSGTATNVLANISMLEYPQHLVKPLMKSLVDILTTSESWRTRLDVLPVLQSEWPGYEI